MRRWLVLLLLAMTPTLAAGGEWPLKQVFGARNVGLVQTRTGAAAEVCVDDACKRFALDGANTLTTVHDFAFLYLALVENYDIEQTKSPAGERYFANVLQRQKGACTGADEAAVARCTLANMAKRYPIQGFVTRMVDGWNRRESWDIGSELRRAKIIP
jgi:hypothetical protein